MENTEMMIYNDPSQMAVSGKEAAFAAVLPLIIGLLAFIADGGTINGEIAEILPMISAVAVPGLVAWILTGLAVNNETAITNTDADMIEEAEVVNYGTE